MVRWLLLSLAVVGFPTSAFSEDESPRPTSDAANAESPDQLKEHQEESVADYIFHHVSDSNELEFEIPLSKGKNPVIHLPIIRVPLKEGACPAGRNQKASLAAGCLDLSITKHTVMMWLAGALLVISVLLGSNRDKRHLVPHGTIANLWEMAVLFVRDELAIKNIGPEEGPRYTPYLLSIFLFILFMNLLGLLPWMATATSNLAITLGLALCTFVLTQVAGIRSAGLGGYLKHLTAGVHWSLWVIMIPVEILGLFTKPFALTVRLFANMLAGHIVIFFLLALIFLLGTVAIAPMSVLFAMGIYFLEMFVGLVQAYVFTMLSSLFIGMAVATGHHDEHGHAPEGDESREHAAAHGVGS
jgi:F-type H+-transporting ATPase subunit a